MQTRRLALLGFAVLALGGCFGDGTYRIGSGEGRIEPGTYSTPGTSSCYWERKSGFTGDVHEILANGFGSGRQIVTVLPTDAGFSASRCGTWVEVDEVPFTSSPTDPFGEGTFRVGIDVAPGTWQSTSTAGRSCYWERLSGFTGDFDELLGNDIGSGTRIAEISPTDIGFSSSGCGPWTKVG